MTPDPARLGATELLAGFASSRLSPVDVAQVLLDAAAEAGQSYRHIVSIDRDGALAAAKESARRWKEGRARPLEGLPFALKGMIPEDGELVRRVQGQGAYLQCRVVPAGFGTPVMYGPGTRPLNPVDPARMPGGSSTGSAIALAAGHVPLAIGSDAAGSIRIPAACCDVMGFKPSRGALPKPGGMALSPTLGEAGPMARAVADLSLLYFALSNGPSSTLRSSPGVRLGRAMIEGLDAETRARVRQATDLLSTLDPAMRDMSLPRLAEARAAGWTVLCYEAHQGMAPHLDVIRRAPTSFLKYAERGRLISASAYQQAIADGTAFAAALDAALQEVDVLVTPCAPFALPRADDPNLPELTPRMGEMFLPFSLSGHPALVLPLQVRGGAVTSIQLVGRRGGDADLLAFAASVERLAPVAR
ncbi:MAG: amidase [Devosia sp.]